MAVLIHMHLLIEQKAQSFSVHRPERGYLPLEKAGLKQKTSKIMNSKAQPDGWALLIRHPYGGSFY